jgi:hypothetical protein
MSLLIFRFWELMDLWELMDIWELMDLCLFNCLIRAFWGNSEVRRFQDGAINESIVWKKPTSVLENVGIVKINDQEIGTEYISPVPIQILDWLLARHFPKVEFVIQKADLGIPIRPLRCLVSPDDQSSLPHSSTSFSELKSILVGLPDLALDIQDVRPVDHMGLLRYFDLPMYNNFPKSINKKAATDQTIPFSYALDYVVDVVIEFGKSGGWPQDNDAIKHMKGALLISIQ